ncbi:MAG: BON domain-containing protein [Betaproteobacteria bacterium]|nr:BON domain-containing protein [Betaproteobacteria bacterium]
MNRKLLAAAALAAVLPALQGCVTVAAVGAGTVAVMANDRRTTGTYVEDENIEWQVIAKLSDDFSNVHVNATSYNRKVLLTGEAPDEATKKRVEDVVRSLAPVASVVNELAVGGNSSLTSRGNDSLITTNVKTRMVNNGKFSTSHVKVVTEASVVYLMGLVTHAEGDAAGDIARSTSGVSRVVKVFEYVPDPAKTH